MKALRALKIVLKDTILTSQRAYLEEAITELEELMKPKSCEGCSKHDYTACPCWDYSNGIPLIEYCSEYEQKEQQ